MSDLKALVVKMPFEKDLGNVIQVARAEGRKIFHNAGKIEVLDLMRRDYGFVVVIQDSKVVVQPKLGVAERV
jgi:hypothetical protein